MRWFIGVKKMRFEVGLEGTEGGCLSEREGEFLFSTWRKHGDTTY